MDLYEYPLGITFRASTPEHAAARVLGGKPSDYECKVREYHTGHWVEVYSADGTWIDDVPVVG